MTLVDRPLGRLALIARAAVEEHRVADSVVPLRPVPFSYFDPNIADAKITANTKLSVDMDGDMPGHTYGLLAPYGRCILDNKPGCWTVDELRADDPKITNAQPHQGDTLVDYGEGDLRKLATANMGGDKGHAADEPWVPTSTIQSFYENTATQMARVRYFWGTQGLCFTGVIWPDVAADTALVAKLESSGTSLHARPILDAGGKLGLVGACMVNQPGLPLFRAASVALDVATFTADDTFTDVVTYFDGTEFWAERSTYSASVASVLDDTVGPPAAPEQRTPRSTPGPVNAAFEDVVPALAQYGDLEGRMWYRVVPEDVAGPDGRPLIIVVADPDDEHGAVHAFPAPDLTPTGLMAVWCENPDPTTTVDDEGFPIDDGAELAAATGAPPVACCAACSGGHDDTHTAAAVGDVRYVIGIDYDDTARGCIAEWVTTSAAAADLTEFVDTHPPVTLTGETITGVDYAALEARFVGAITHDDHSTIDLPDGQYRLALSAEPVAAAVDAAFRAMLAADIDDALAAFDSSKHPRNPKGNKGAPGGRFAPVDKSKSAPSGPSKSGPSKEDRDTAADKNRINDRVSKDRRDDAADQSKTKAERDADRRETSRDHLDKAKPANDVGSDEHSRAKHDKGGGGAKKKSGGKGKTAPEVKPPAGFDDAAAVKIPGHGTGPAAVKTYGTGDKAQTAYVSTEPYGDPPMLAVGLVDKDGAPVPGFVAKDFPADESAEAARYVESEQRRLALAARTKSSPLSASGINAALATMAVADTDAALRRLGSTMNCGPVARYDSNGRLIPGLDIKKSRRRRKR